VINASDIEQLSFDAGLAPSVSNLQPWKIEVGADKIDIFLNADLVKTLPTIVINACVFSLGSFIENMKLSADSLSLDYRLELLSPSDVYGAFARFSFTGRNPDKGEDVLYSYLATRVTNRQFADNKQVTEEQIGTLDELLSERYPDLCLRTVSSEASKLEAANILGKADAFRIYNDPLLKQSFREVRWTDSEAKETRDGIDINTLELPPQVVKQFKMLKRFPFIRKIIPKRAFEGMAKDAIIHSSHLCSLNIKIDPNWRGMLMAGMGAQRLWLKATQLDLAVHPWAIFPFLFIARKFNQSDFFTDKENNLIDGLAEKYSRLFGFSEGEWPVFFFRVSNAPTPSKRSLRLDPSGFTHITSDG